MTQSPAVDPLPAAPSDLARLADLATEAGLPALARQASREIERLAEGRFYVACIGQFKRGKSTPHQRAPTSRSPGFKFGSDSSRGPVSPRARNRLSLMS